MHPIINALGFQTAWWFCIAGVGRALEIPALIYGLTLAGLHLAFAPKASQEFKMAAIALAMGIGVDSMLQVSSVIQFYGWSLAFLSPFWLWLLWVLFGMTLNSSLSFLQSLPLWVSGLTGLVFGPLTYYAGAQLGAASFDGSRIHIMALAIAWMMALPALVYMAKQLFTSPQGQTQ